MAGVQRREVSRVHVHSLKAAAALSLLASFLLLPPAAAKAATGSSISGTVASSATSSPIEGAEACAYAASSGYYAGCGITDSSGHYAITGLAPGTYKVQFLAGGLDYAPQYFDGKPTRSSADPVQVSSGATTSSIDAALANGGHIAGTVTAAGTNAPIDEAEVCATELGGGEYERCSDTDPNGDYVIESLPEGSFRVAFYAGYGELEAGIFGTRNFVKQYWQGKESAAEADHVSVSTGATANGIDAAMREGGMIAGTVTDAVSHAGLESVEVCAFESGASEPLRCQRSGENGRYVIAGLAAGDYKVGFTPDYSDHTHDSQYYSGKSTLASADSVSVSEGNKTAGIAVALPELGKVSGHVSASGGGALENISVCAEPVKFEYGGFRCGSTNASGDYVITGVKSGSYVIHFNGGLDHLGQYYNGKSSFSKADRVAVADAATTAGINAELGLAGRISGHVTDAETHAALADVEVCAAPPGTFYLAADNCAYTGSSGEYTIGGLPSGSYQVHFTPGFGETSPGHYGPLNYLPQYYQGKESEAEAEVVSVSAGSTRGSIDAAMHPGGKIMGTVTAALGHAPLENIQVCVRGGSTSSCTATGSDGTYTMSGLPSGEYKVKFSPGSQNYVRQFYSGKATGKSADPVAVTAGQTKSGIDAQLQNGGKITGAVTDASSHDPIDGAQVCVVEYSAPCGYTDSAGEYEIKGLPTGSYKVRFDPYEAVGYLQQYFHGKEHASEAEPVAVSAGTTTAAVDAAMVAGGSISGIVTDAVSGDGAHLVQVCALEPGGDELDYCAQTNSSGRYTIHGLKAGVYSVRFSPGYDEYGSEEAANENYVTQFYSGKATLAEANLVTVTDGAPTSGIDAAMHEGGKISGRVTAASGGAPISRAEACIYTEGESEPDWQYCADTDEDGEYTIEGLPTGSYKVVFYEGFGGFEERNFLGQFYSDKSSPAAADPVSVVAGSTHQHVDAALASGGQITGHVIDASSAKNVAGAEACALEASGEGEVVSCGETNSLGNYAISSLPTGSYKVEFSDLRYEYEEEEEEGEAPAPEELYVRQYWNGSPTPGSAQAVNVSAGSVTGGINASLVSGGGGPGGQQTLSVGFSGSGAGTVSSSPAGIACSTSCAHSFAAGTEVTLTANPASGSTFAGWAGACAGTGACRVTLDGDVSVVAAFNPESSAGGGSGGGGGGGSSGGGSGAGTSGGSTPGGGSSPSATPKPLKCKKGFKKTKVKGKAKCVRTAHHGHGKNREARPSTPGKAGRAR